VIWRSSVSSVPLSLIVPVTCTPLADNAAARVSLTTSAGDFFASPFELEPPQPASSTSAASTAATTPVRAPARTAESLSNSIAGVQARGIHHVGVAVADLDEAVRTYERLFGGRV